MRGFTRDVQKAIEIAQTYAQRTSGNLGTEHFLIGILNVRDSYAAEILLRLGLDIDDVDNYLVYNDFSEKIIISNIAKRALELSRVIANGYKYDIADTQHLLLAIAYDPNSAASKILAHKKINFDALKDIVDAMSYNGIGTDCPTTEDKTSKSFYQTEQSNNTADNNSIFNSSKSNQQDDPLSQIGTDLTQKASSGKIDPIIGRSKEIERIIQILSRRTKNNPILIGEAGVGKSAIVEGLALAIVSGDVPEILKGKKIFSLDVGSLVAGTKYRGEFEEKLKNAIDKIKSNNTILFIDEIHTIVSAGNSEGGMNISNILKPLLARGEISTIGATTIAEYRQYIEKDAALERRFQPIVVEPPSVDDTITILKGIREKYEIHHKVKINDSALISAATLSDRYITDRFLPDKAIDLIDEAASKMRISNLIAPQDAKIIEDKLSVIENSINQAVQTEEYQKAWQLKTEKKQLLEELNNIKSQWGKEKIGKELEITDKEIAVIVSDWTKIPVVSLTEAESAKLLKLEDTLNSRVIGQKEAVKSIANAVKRARAGLKDPKRPIGSFIFLGPTGVGKTELSKALADAMFGDENALIRIDMSEYMDKSNVSRLIGAAPGFVGYDEGGQLTEKIRRKPYSVLLFDEIEKAHPEVFNLLLQVLDEGRLTDSHGRQVSFKNTIIIMTSNIGASEIEKMKPVGFGNVEVSKVDDYEFMKERQLEALKNTMRPEFINRIDDIIIFRKLDIGAIAQILDLMLKNLASRLIEKNVKLIVNEKARALILNQGYDNVYGARPLKRTIQRLVEDKLSEEIIKNNLIDNDNVIVDANDNNLTFDIIHS